MELKVKPGQDFSDLEIDPGGLIKGNYGSWKRNPVRNYGDHIISQIERRGEKTFVHCGTPS